MAKKGGASAGKGGGKNTAAAKNDDGADSSKKVKPLSALASLDLCRALANNGMWRAMVAR